MALLYVAAQLAVWIGCAIAWVRSPELERAAMRSSSWPSPPDENISENFSDSAHFV
jgi:hypothetical protein